MSGVYAVFTLQTYGGKRSMHAVRIGETRTVCDLPTGTGSGLVRDGDYRANVPCPRCWPRKASA